MPEAPKGVLPRVIELRGITQTYDGGRTFLFNKLNLPKPVKYGKGKTISTAVAVLDELALTPEVPTLVL